MGPLGAGVVSAADLQRLALRQFQTGALSRSVPMSTSSSSRASGSSSGLGSSTPSAPVPLPPSWTKAGWAARRAELEANKVTVTAATAKPVAEKKKSKKKRKAETLEETWEVRPVRALAPGRLKYRRGSLRRALRRTRTPQALEMMTRSYEDRKLAPGSRKAQTAKIAFWTRRARSHGVAAFPLDIPKLKLLGGGPAVCRCLQELWILILSGQG